MAKRDGIVIDTWLLGAFLTLMLLGIIMVYSASAFYAQHYFNDHLFFLKRHGFNLVVGIFAGVAALAVPYHRLRGWTWIALLGGFVILVWALFVAEGRWIHIGPIHFQAVDVAKFCLILFFADSLSRKEEILQRFGEGLFPHLVYVGVFGLLVVFQPDFSSTVMLVLVALTMLFAAPVRLHHLFLTGLAFLPFAVAVVWRSAYKLARVKSFLDPSGDIKGSGYQVHQSLVSLGHGGITGLGFAGSTQKMFFLPEAHTDFIFAIIGEEWGLIGTLFVVGLFWIIAWRGMRLALRMTDRFYRYLVVGITAHFFYYAVVNMMVTLGLLPATGLPLPFISYGGTALVFSCIYAAILLKIASTGLGMPDGVPRMPRQGTPGRPVYLAQALYRNRRP